VARTKKKGQGRAKEATFAAGDVKDLLVAYAKQETVDPLKGLARFVGFGVGAMLLIGIGGVCLILALLRVLQTETGTTFAGNWSWAPYLITLAAAGVVIALALHAITSNGSRKTP
jgi:hypothetical protein